MVVVMVFATIVMKNYGLATSTTVIYGMKRKSVSLFVQYATNRYNSSLLYNNEKTNYVEAWISWTFVILHNHEHPFFHLKQEISIVFQTFFYFFLRKTIKLACTFHSRIRGVIENIFITKLIYIPVISTIFSYILTDHYLEKTASNGYPVLYISIFIIRFVYGIVYFEFIFI